MAPLPSPTGRPIYPGGSMMPNCSRWWRRATTSSKRPSRGCVFFSFFWNKGFDMITARPTSAGGGAAAALWSSTTYSTSTATCPRCRPSASSPLAPTRCRQRPRQRRALARAATMRVAACRCPGRSSSRPRAQTTSVTDWGCVMALPTTRTARYSWPRSRCRADRTQRCV